jgi:hypothetical protein
MVIYRWLACLPLLRHLPARLLHGVLFQQSFGDAARRLTPEERAVAVHYSGAEAVEELEKADPQRDWREGLDWLQKDSQRRFGKTLLELSQDPQIQLLADTSRQSEGRAGEGPPARLYAVLKSQAIQGYYTSRRGLDELDYQGNTYHVECPCCADHESP